ncbi:MAG: hypothetical protein ACR2MD_01025 [Aridibacter sp.]
MPSLKKQTENAVYDALDVVNVRTLAVNGIWLNIAGEAVKDYPFVVFGWLAFGENQYTFQFGSKTENGIFLIKAYSDENSDPLSSASEYNDEILEACETELYNGLPLETGKVLYFRRQRHTPDIQDSFGGRQGLGSGRTYRVYME